MDKIDIELNNEVLNEVLSTPPSWLLRSGNTLFLFVTLTLVTLCYFIQYPDEIQGDVVIQGNKPPIEFQNQMFGKLNLLSIKDQDNVKKGDVLAQFNNQIKPKNIEYVNEFLLKLGQIDQLSLEHIQYYENIELGTLQLPWQSLLSTIKEYKELRNANLQHKKIMTLKSEIIQRNQLLEIANQQLKLIVKEHYFQKEQIKLAEHLINKNAISKEELSKEVKAELQLLHQYHNQREAIVQQNIQINLLKKNLQELMFETKVQIQKLELNIRTQKSGLKTQLDEWGKNTAWIAPCDGKILFNKQLNVSHFYKSGEATVVLIPKGNVFVSTVSVDMEGAGKIRSGQKVLIELADFPKNEFGVIEGIVRHKTSIAKDNKYEVLVSLPHKMYSSFEKEIPIKAVLKGTAKIITQDKRLIERFFDKIINAINRR